MKSGLLHVYSNTIGTPPAGASLYMFAAGLNGSNVPFQFNFPIKLKNLLVSTPQAPGVGERYTYDVISNGAATGISAVINDQNLLGLDRAHDVVLPAGRWPLILLTLSQGALPTFFAASLEYEEVAGDAWKPVVFVGDSITCSWAYPGGLRALNRGVAGRTTPEIRDAFSAEVMSLNPRTVHILGGSNDMRLLQGASVGPLETMAVAARAAGCRVLVGTIPPISASSPYVPTGGNSVEGWNAAIHNSATLSACEIVDYYSAMVNGDGSQNASLFVADGLHPNAAGYAVMESVASAMGVSQ